MEGKKVDTKEFELPETLFERDIENRIFQGIVLECLSKIMGISPIDGNFIDHFLGRTESVKGIHAEQDPKTHSIGIKVEVNIAYGISIPEKAEEIQTKIAEDVTRMTGLHVSCVHVIFKDLIRREVAKKIQAKEADTKPPHAATLAEEYSDVF